MPNIDPPESCLPTAGTVVAALFATLALTFCTPAPAAQDDLTKRCVKTTLTFIAIVDDVTTENTAQAMFDGLDMPDKKWLVETALPAYKLAGEPPLEQAVPHVYKHCMDRGMV
jgi:hypothetical protein